jgi:hypothetical protein
MKCETCTANDKRGGGGLGTAVAAKVAEVENMASHAWPVMCCGSQLSSGQHLNRPCNSGEATK